jgi:hypothetical protein
VSDYDNWKSTKPEPPPELCPSCGDEVELFDVLGEYACEYCLYEYCGIARCDNCGEWGMKVLLDKSGWCPECLLAATETEE